MPYKIKLAATYPTKVIYTITIIGNLSGKDVFDMYMDVQKICAEYTDNDQAVSFKYRRINNVV